ncbi:hypothetical protein [Pseudosulfitobacter sp. DSM 107133]|jgi:hypothetical protein|nr:hypothetical protein [Pseudosulfitobacter sp. DSM 107133]
MKYNGQSGMMLHLFCPHKAQETLKNLAVRAVAAYQPATLMERL